MPLSKIPSKVRSIGQRLPTEAGQQIGKLILSSIDTTIEHRWAAAQQRATRIDGDSIDAKISALSKSFARELGTVGAVTGAAATVPSFGTAAALSAGVAELGWFTVRASELILTIGALRGHTQSTVDERRAWILSILVFGKGAAEGFTKLAGKAGKGVGKKSTTRIPMSVIRGLNSSMGRTIITKYGRKRGMIALGTALPFGIGALVGGGANYAGVRALAQHANKFFKHLPYETVPATT